MTSFRLAADIGGTFTDVVLERDDNAQRVTTKVLTTYADPANGVMKGIDQVLQQANLPAGGARLVLHGTTLATNALIERRGAKTALLTTEGHRDAVEMALENRFEQYDVNIDRPAPLVPRALRIPIAERLDAQGRVLVPLDQRSVEAAIRQLAAAHVESVVVGFLHGYANVAHEKQVGERLGQAMPEVSITLASSVCPEIREYERLSTACANAYVKPMMARYLRSLQEQLVGRGVGAPVLMMTSGGGLTTLANAAEFPIRLVESGPAGGAILAAHVAAQGGYSQVLSFDMGGTTAKICLIDDGQPLFSRSFEVDRVYRFKKGSGLPVRIPVIEMVEIGAGGGSKVRVDKLNRITVGPDSAGSEPGPACYGRGGQAATVTDADVLLGKLAADWFAGGQMNLDAAAAQSAVLADVAQPLGLEAAQAAYAVSEVVDENMAAAARAHAVEWGQLAEGRTLVAYGGAAPLHAARLADKLKLDRIVVPAGAGVGSAIGFLIAPVSYEVVRSRFMRLSQFDLAAVVEALEEMRVEALEVVRAATDVEELEESRRAYMRYAGQGYEIAVPVPENDIAGVLSVAAAESLRAAFDQEYARLYGRTIPNLDVEVLSWTLTLGESSAASLQPAEQQMASRGRSVVAQRWVELFDAESGLATQAGRFLREDLQPGDCVRGPSVILEAQTTTVVSGEFVARVTGTGDLVLDRVGAQA